MCEVGWEKNFRPKGSLKPVDLFVSDLVGTKSQAQPAQASKVRRWVEMAEALNASKRTRFGLHSSLQVRGRTRGSSLSAGDFISDGVRQRSCRVSTRAGT